MFKPWNVVIASLVVLGTLATSYTVIAVTAAEPAPISETREIVKYHLQDWKKVHTGNHDEAEKLLKTFKTLKVETQVADHGNHKDVKYRCTAWKQLSVKDHTTAHQWETWLKKLGFDTIHEH